MQERRGFLAFYTPKLYKLISEGKKDEAAENRIKFMEFYIRESAK